MVGWCRRASNYPDMGCSRHNATVRYVRLILVAGATVTGVLLAVVGTFFAYREWAPDTPCIDTIVIEPGPSIAACLAPPAPWWLLLVVALAVGSATAWASARATRDRFGAHTPTS